VRKLLHSKVDEVFENLHTNPLFTKGDTKRGSIGRRATLTDQDLNLYEAKL